MPAMMVVLMDMDDTEWMKAYGSSVSELLRKHGARTIAGARTILRLEGDMPTPDRMAILSFPDAGAASAFLADPLYAPFSQLRKEHTRSTIFVFDDEVSEDQPLA